MHSMPKENDERYASTFGTFSTQGCNAADKFGITEGNLCVQKIHVAGKVQDVDRHPRVPAANNEFESRQTFVDF
jgi:hypothetical protein